MITVFKVINLKELETGGDGRDSGELGKDIPAVSQDPERDDNLEDGNLDEGKLKGENLETWNMVKVVSRISSDDYVVNKLQVRWQVKMYVLSKIGISGHKSKCIKRIVCSDV